MIPYNHQPTGVLNNAAQLQPPLDHQNPATKAWNALGHMAQNEEAKIGDEKSARVPGIDGKDDDFLPIFCMLNPDFFLFTLIFWSA